MKVLLATDSSACSQIAIASVLGMKWADNTEFKVVTVVGLFEPLQMVDEIQDDEILLAKKYIASVVDEVKAALPQTKVTGDVLVGHTDFIIKQAAGEFGADLIVVGSHGRRGLSRFLLGSVSRGVLIGAPCAVRIVRHSAHTLDHVIQSPWPDGTKFKCISVIRQDYPFVFLDPMNVPGIPIELPEMRKNVSLSLEQAVARLDGAFGQGSANCQVLVGDPREEILEAAKKWSASLIMLGSHGHKLMETVFLGSVSDAVATHAHCSVEVTRLPTKTPATTTAI